MVESRLTPETKFGMWKTARERRMRIAVTACWMARFRDAAQALSLNPTPEETFKATAHTAQADALAEELAFLLGESLPEALQK